MKAASCHYMSGMRLLFCDQVAYAEFPVAAVGSLAYAEDDNKHILGIKAVQTPPPAEGGEGTGYCCHVLECDNEVR